MAVTFSALASSVASGIGRPEVFVAAAVAIVLAIGAACVPGWREPVNIWGGAITGYVSILLLVVLQNSTTRDALAIQVKLDQLVLASAASNEFAGIDQRLSEDALRQLRAQPGLP
jgi:low affinity Fe/Cu permease